MGSSAAAEIGDGAVGGLEEWSFESDGGWWVICSSADPPRAERINYGWTNRRSEGLEIRYRDMACA